MVRDEEGTKRQREDDLEERQKSRTLCAENSTKIKPFPEQAFGSGFFLNLS